MVTTSTFKIRFPEFESQDNARVQLFLDDAATQVSKTKFGTSYDLAIFYLIAHYLSLSEKSANGSSGNVGAVASKSVEGVSVSYNQATANTQCESYYITTSYGQRYLEIKSQIAVGNAMSV